MYELSAQEFPARLELRPLWAGLSTWL